jgi:hypothetical protein
MRCAAQQRGGNHACQIWLTLLTAIATIAFTTQAYAQAMAREQKVISSAGA